ncbi:acetylornithine deacetylase/succinyl-diaminopimelate desuccinylase [Prosthecobacter fusiformis]|uniref:Acetylornithine deacetylase/succinyl-diaminopimelate desuccinylase n=1 Tax=Prosthecobacter fusiformis TaxID=48464 RepID=A0A4R7RKR5_9BACT|nr:M20 family metallopeptidase [Prosthecobacter fusiformis]TDU64132.1 acetylornithine deacetylase/succinyl-diaminopimelate desuccinylase [Prosthecobacter fusiformis]
MNPQPANVIELCQALVRIPSVNPDGDPGCDQTGEAACATYVGQFLAASGATVQLEEVEPGRPNVIGRFPTRPSADGKPKPRIVFAPHTDTVSVGGMTIDPFGGDLRDDRIWGRGASDTKGPMAAMLWALYEMRADIPSLPVEVHFAGFMSEESAQLGSQHFARTHGPYDFALIGEPTGMRTVHKHKGCLWADVHTTGVAVHGSIPEKGVNAIVKMASLIHALDIEFRQVLKDTGGEDEWLGFSTINLGMIRGGTRSNIVADQCVLRVDMRTTPGLARAGGAVAVLTEFVRQRDATASVVPLPETFPLNTDATNPFVQRLVECGSSVTGAPWFCDAAFLAAGGTPAVAIGPGGIAQAHTKDEHIAVSDLQDGVNFFVKFLKSWQV